MPLHDGRKKLDPNKKPFILKIRLFFIKNKKKIRNLFILLIICAILFFPVWSGSLIGNWIKDFIGTALNIIKTI